MRYRTRLSQILIGVLVCLIVTACSGTGEVDPTLSPPPELTATDAPPTAVPEPDPTMIGESSTVVAQGAFVGADAAHQGSGSARIVRRGDGDFVLQLEDFSVTDGPDLYVYLSSSTAPGSGGALGSYVDLGLLQSATGDQTYDIPDETAVEDYASVVIYCLAYEVLFAHAPLSDSE